MLTKKQAALRRKVWAHYRKHGRHDLPWRMTTDPYRILVSEVMLQQTQVSRVLPKYQAFVKEFPSVEKLAKAKLRDVLVLWQGLGYNRRGKALRDAAQVVAELHGGCMPRDRKALEALPGVGPYTASAVCAFAYNEPVVMIETNIRTVLLHELLSGREQVPDAQLYELVEVLLPRARSRVWYWALMDYGAYLKGQGVRLNSKSKHYTKQSKFEGSDRQVRGAILQALTCGSMTERDLAQKTKTAPARVRTQLHKLQNEGMVRSVHNLWDL